MGKISKSDLEKPLAQNKKASHDYNITDTIEAGIVLTGTEIKSVRQSKIQVRDGFARVKDGEVWLSGVHIAEYSQGNIYNHEEMRSRKLLMHKKQIQQVEKALQDKGMTFIPLKVYLKNGYAKVLMGLAKGKHDYDKRESIKQNDLNREVKRQLKNYQTR